MKTREEKIQIIEEVAMAIGGKVNRDYSGRHMYGRTCYGIKCEGAQSAIEEAAERGLKGASTDQLGKGYIVYWSSIRGDNDDSPR